MSGDHVFTDVILSVHIGWGRGGLLHLHCSHVLWGVPHLHPIILPLSLCPFQGFHPIIFLVPDPFRGLGGTPVLSQVLPWDYPSAVTGLNQGVTLGQPPPPQLGMGYLPTPGTGVPPTPLGSTSHGQDALRSVCLLRFKQEDCPLLDDM